MQLSRSDHLIPGLSKLAPQALPISKERRPDEALGNRLISICHLRFVFAKAAADRFQICDCAQLTHFNWTPHGRTRYLNFCFAFARQ